MASETEHDASRRSSENLSNKPDEAQSNPVAEASSEVQEQIQAKIAAQLRHTVQEDEGVEILTEYIWHMAKDPNISLQFMNEELVEFLDDKAPAFSKWLSSEVLPYMRPTSQTNTHEAGDKGDREFTSSNLDLPHSQRSDGHEGGQRTNGEDGRRASPDIPPVSKFSSDFNTAKKRERRSRILGLAVRQVAEEQNPQSRGEVISKWSGEMRHRATNRSPSRQQPRGPDLRSHNENYNRFSRHIVLEDNDGLVEDRRNPAGRHNRERARDEHRRMGRSGGSDYRTGMGGPRGFSGGYDDGFTEDRRMRDEPKIVFRQSRSRSRNGSRSNRRKWRSMDDTGGVYDPNGSNRYDTEMSCRGDRGDGRNEITNSRRNNTYEYSQSTNQRSESCRAVLRPNPHYESYGVEESQQPHFDSHEYTNVDNTGSNSYFKQIPSGGDGGMSIHHGPNNISTDQTGFSYRTQLHTEHQGDVMQHGPVQDAMMTSQWQPQSQQQAVGLSPSQIPQQPIWNTAPPQPWQQGGPPLFPMNMSQPQQMQQHAPHMQQLATNRNLHYPPTAAADANLEKYLGSKVSPKRVTKISKRCMNYPECKFGDNCRYVHPTEMCQSWPRCSYGMECFFIHPEVSCKYGTHCLNWHCNYTHPVNWNPPMTNNMLGLFGGIDAFPKFGGGVQAKYPNKTLHIAFPSTNSEDLVVEAVDEGIETDAEPPPSAEPADEVNVQLL